MCQLLSKFEIDRRKSGYSTQFLANRQRFFVKYLQYSESPNFEVDLEAEGLLNKASASSSVLDIPQGIVVTQKILPPWTHFHLQE